ncbi:hypothetical protein SDC9_173105 [bioreactor metagenome]|uniref:Uncharacterized protein n=1 Tax=bioreactor metagenome TaxID=1076179 RepID=A0A645GFJ0_9ZZZZ
MRRENDHGIGVQLSNTPRQLAVSRAGCADFAFLALSNLGQDNRRMRHDRSQSNRHINSSLSDVLGLDDLIV